MPRKQNYYFDDQRIRDLNAAVQTFIRTQPGFNSSQPTKFRCSVPLIQANCDPDAWNPENVPFITILELVNSSKHDNSYKLHKGSKVSVTDLTPFQGDESNRMFGEYSCRCGRQWMSAGSWKNMFQKCQRCERKVYPHTQSERKKRDGDDDVEVPKQPHDCARCQKCIVKGSLCMPKYYYEI